MLRTVIIGIGLLLGAVRTVAAAEIVKVAVPERGEWNTSFTQLASSRASSNSRASWLRSFTSRRKLA